MAVLEKLVGLGDVIKWIVIGIISLVFMAVFFMYFGRFFIPIVLCVLVIAFLYFTGAYQKTPPVQMALMLFIAFIGGYFIQRISTVALSVLSGTVLTEPSFDTFDLIMLSLTVIGLVFAVSTQIKIGKMIKQRGR
jgi:hypothetical protein